MSNTNNSLLTTAQCGCGWYLSLDGQVVHLGLGGHPHPVQLLLDRSQALPHMGGDSLVFLHLLRAPEGQELSPYWDMTHYPGKINLVHPGTHSDVKCNHNVFNVTLSIEAVGPYVRWHIETAGH